MSKIHKNYGWLNTRSNSAKTLLARAKQEVPGSTDQIGKFEKTNPEHVPQVKNGEQSLRPSPMVFFYLLHIY